MDLDEILGKYRVFMTDGRVTNFAGITTSLITAVYMSSNMKNQAEVDKYLSHVREYIRLLDDFPEFKEKELSIKIAINISNSLEYIRKQYRELRGVPFIQQ